MLQAESVTITRQEYSPRVTDSHPDADLLNLGEALDASSARLKALHDLITEENEHLMVEVIEICLDYAQPIVERIEKLRAHTLDGLRVKAKAIKWCHGGEEIQLAPDMPTTDARIAESILRDLLAA